MATVSDGTPMTCELRFHGESYGWEALFRDDGSLAIGRGGFALRADAARWAHEEHAAQRADGVWAAIAS